MRNNQSEFVAPDESQNSEINTGQVIGPDSQPEQPQTPMPKAKGKKPIIVALIVLLLLAVGAGLWFFVFNKQVKQVNSESPSDASQQDDTSDFKDATHFAQTGNIITFLDGAGFDDVRVDDNDTVVQAIKTETVPELRYTTYKELENGGRNLESYGVITGDGKKESFKFAAGTDYFYSNPIVSPDGTKIIVEESDAGGLMTNLTTYNVSDGSSKQVYKPSKTAKGLYVFVAWKDDNTVLLQAQTCRQCDGPRKAELVTLDINSGKIAPFYKGDGKQLEYASFTESHDGKSLYLLGGSYGKIFEGDLGITYPSDFIYQIDKATGKATQLAELKDQGYNNIIGVADDGIYFSSTKHVKTNDPNPTASYIDLGNFNPLSTLKFLPLSNGAIRDVALDTNLIKEKTVLNQVVPTSDRILILVSNSDTTHENTTYDVLMHPNVVENNIAESMMQAALTSADTARLFEAK